MRLLSPSSRSERRVLVLLLALIALAPLCAARPWAAARALAADAPAVRVEGNQLVDASGQPLRLLGVNRAGTEDACFQGWGIFEGPSDAASVQAIAGWRANAVRVPLNEDCWLGINGVPRAYGGASYQAAIADYVGLLNQYGLVVILELHWSAPGTAPAIGQQPMPDRDHAPEFWRSVAATFKGNGAVVFDLFNEPYPDSNRDTAEAWRCWRDGGSCAGLGYQAAGMQELVDAVRATGASNVIMLGGVQYAARLSQWLAYRPADPLGNLAATWHIYDFSWCADRACWDAEVDRVARQAPLVLGELGQGGCAAGLVDALMDWMDARGQSYLGWTWNTWGAGCDDHALIRDYAGTPTVPYGRAFKDHFATQAATPSPTTPPADLGGAALCFPGFTPHCTGGAFRARWEATGGLPVNGYPLSEALWQVLEDGGGYWVQYFERVRMEWHPEQADPGYRVLLGQFGRRILRAELGREADPAAPPLPGAAYDGITGHNVDPRFLGDWQAGGGLPQFGRPLTETTRQVLEDGREYEVQYFERARFEWHPEINDGRGGVLLGQFGRRVLAETAR